MKTYVIVRQTPDTEAKIKVNGDGRSINSESIKWIVNPYDEFAIEEAIRIKENHGGEVILITMGPARNLAALRTGLAMGADSAIHIKDESFASADPYAIAKVIAQEIKNPGDYDLILTGKKMIDEETGQVGIHVAEDLGIPQGAVVTKLDISDDRKSVRVQKEIEGGQVIVDLPLPALLTCERGLNEPRYASLPGIMKAKKKPVKVIETGDIDFSSIGLSAEQLGEGGSRYAVTKLEVPEIKRRLHMIEGMEVSDAVKELVTALREEAKVI
ncbi:MAG: electron transfer flavoprotein subunit beta/FixA family protein [Candidatus Dadabacteria bacterium]|nr:electron transfer flavoprotein subunit beta/FixA family protein [Candidatus Dadabacteria bacterium]